VREIVEDGDHPFLDPVDMRDALGEAEIGGRGGGDRIERTGDAHLLARTEHVAHHRGEDYRQALEIGRRHRGADAGIIFAHPREAQPLGGFDQPLGMRREILDHDHRLAFAADPVDADRGR